MINIFRNEQSLSEANKGEIKDAIKRLFTLSTNDYGYYLFLVLSVIITTAGLMVKSAPVIIGGMIIAPILTPMLACGLAVFLLEFKGFVHALTIVLISVVIAFVLSSAMTFTVMFIEPEAAVFEYSQALVSPGLYILIAFSAGIAGAFAFVKSHLSSSISGVAVSASLMPPLCSIGIGAVLKNDVLVRDSLTIFLLNVFGIVLASAVVFWILGFWKERKFEEKTAEKVNDKD
ncbi:DUF389 domain-containing protein [Candidatus Peribacteria bacterium]|jgi:uncharacterized hydrophobic protein (TIGR00271 family)|nr:DUF389 domain-containing protein [Candidatus Peribacteria bacterium]MBT4021341.1 DUF389 domain-containing protein [Candidatus Peribacteria bacterium]MBT4241198.1 DUF389 domain-containing protein [Candidatus Peribacteria bacterium]MBT4474223.1 DUF389 domain-containing protein [Candidatus Peribacteria bacterium]